MKKRMMCLFLAMVLIVSTCGMSPSVDGEDVPDVEVPEETTAPQEVPENPESEVTEEPSEPEATEEPDSESEAPMESGGTSGNCGPGGLKDDSVTWELTDDGTLTISGTGPMMDYTSVRSPWYRSTDVKRVIVEDGVTSIGQYAFWECGNLTEVNFH